MSIPNNKKSETGTGSGKKMLFYDVRSRNVYENKQNVDKMPDEKSDIYVDVTRFLQKIAGCDTDFAENCGFGRIIFHDLRFRGLLGTQIYREHSVAALPP